jgi:hypothetical protein
MVSQWFIINTIVDNPTVYAHFPSSNAIFWRKKPGRAYSQTSPQSSWAAQALLRLMFGAENFTMDMEQATE